jgi:3-methyl-2-oxobutanoate hydroxymethyltransferase
VAASDSSAARTDQLLVEAKLLEETGASLLDFTSSGPVAGPEVVRAVTIPVIGGLGGGPWLDGRVRSVFAAIGYLAAAVDDATPRYANVAEIALTAIKAFGDDVRAARQIR